MPRSGPLFVDDRDQRDLERLLADYRLGRLGRGRVNDDESRRSSDPVNVITQTVVLLEDLRGTAFISRAENLKVETSRYTLDVLIVGYPPTSMTTFTIRVDGVEKTIQLGATAEEFKSQSGVTGDVTLGTAIVDDNGTERRLSPCRWRISWSGGESLRTPPADAQIITAGAGGTNWFTRVEQTLTVGTGKRCEVIQTIPTGWDTPLRAGAVCEVVKGKGKYWKVIGAEARLWSSIGTSGVEP
jgi:hypothetical protein